MSEDDELECRCRLFILRYFAKFINKKNCEGKKEFLLFLLAGNQEDQTAIQNFKETYL
jgi:hypothetical protein